MMYKLLLFIKLKSNYSDWFFWSFFIALVFLFYGSFLGKEPTNTHIWRQTDCLSITKNYYEGAPFFQPQMNIQLGNNYSNGKSAGEFPILYYSVAQVWKIFGVSYFSYRFFMLIILSSGIFLFYKALKIVFDDVFWATILSLMLFISPVFAYYGVSFLTDGTAFSFNLIGLYFIVKYGKFEKQSSFWWGMFFFTLAGLLKISSLIIFVFFGFIFMLERFSIKTLNRRKLFPENKLIFGFIAVIFYILTWYVYAHFYNSYSGFKYTFNGIDPVWDFSSQAEIHWLKRWKDFLLFPTHVFHSRLMIITMLFAFVFNLFLYKKIPLILFLSNIVICFGCGIYFLLWSGLIHVHDYYFIALLALFIGTVPALVYYIKTHLHHIYKGKLTKVGVLIFFVINLLVCSYTIKLKTDTVKGNSPFLFLNTDFVELMNWTNMHENQKWSQYAKIKSKFKNWNIKKDDKVICFSDVSFNISLFFLNQKGWTNFEHYTEKSQIKNLINHGAKYLFIEKKDLDTNPFLKPFTNNYVGEFKNLQVFKLPH